MPGDPPGGPKGRPLPRPGNLFAEMRIYLDHNATTPLRPEVLVAMTETLGNAYGNPSSGHAEGAHAKALVEAHGGRISARNVPDAGAAFTLTLPIPLRSAAAAADA